VGALTLLSAVFHREVLSRGFMEKCSIERIENPAPSTHPTLFVVQIAAEIVERLEME